jgi:hypothetical protein
MLHGAWYTFDTFVQYCYNLPHPALSALTVPPFFFLQHGLTHPPPWTLSSVASSDGTVGPLPVGWSVECVLPVCWGWEGAVLLLLHSAWLLALARPLFIALMLRMCSSAMAHQCPIGPPVLYIWLSCFTFLPSIRGTPRCGHFRCIITAAV